MNGNFPWEVLYHIPEWCIYIETKDFSLFGEVVHGAWINIDGDAISNKRYLQILIDSRFQISISLELSHETIAEQVKNMLENSRLREDSDIGQLLKSGPDMVSLLNTLISLTLFICTQSSEVVGGVVHPANPTPKRIKGGEFRLFPPNRVTTWEVGVRMGAALRQARKYAAANQGGEAALRNAPRGHIRRAHWHTILSGPRILENGEPVPSAHRTLQVRWQPPLAINLKDASELPATIRVVASDNRTTLH